VTVVRPEDDAYPVALRTLSEPPPLLYVRGTLRPEDAVAVAVVGARRATPYGLHIAEQLGRDLARHGVTVVSGLARGIDGAAHRGALAAGGRTLAVLGCGPDRAYPPEHARLLAQVVAAGAVLSEYPPGTPPLRHHFPLRNRLISGLSLGVVVVEGREDSGALITAECALAQGREVLAVPGSIFAPTSALPLRLLHEGATPVRHVEDVLDALRLPRRAASPAAPQPVALDGPEALLYGHLALEPQHIDVLARRCALPVATVGASLTVLELRGLVRALPGQRYVRVP